MGSLDAPETTDTDDSGAVALYQVRGDALDALRTPLATILGRAQLLEHRMLRGHPIPPDEYLSALAVIARSVWALESQLRMLQDQAYRAPEEDD